MRGLGIVRGAREDVAVQDRGLGQAAGLGEARSTREQ